MCCVNVFFQGITVREGDSNLITRCESKTLGKMEMIREFSKDGMTLVSNLYIKKILLLKAISLQFIKLLDRDFEAVRFFKRI